MVRRFELIVFDWDGTLIDSAGAIVACIQAAARDVGVPVPDEERASHVIGLGLRDALSHAVPGLGADQYAAFVERYRVHFLARDAHLPLFPGTREMLLALRARGHTLAIATGKSRAGLARALAQADLAEVFAATRCADQCEPKPHPAMLHELMEELDGAPETTLMIGDTSHDLRMAAAAGVPALAVTYGAHPHETLRALAPLALVASSEELAKWLQANA
ncbi:MAG: HAD-IA family hydrolase [Burkholderiales bacterium]|jgi:phosphoglycolate phosphatase|nr:HAD-IA family hydrolase [Burkholderiales bacterium]